jgi:hypothetical protein
LVVGCHRAAVRAGRGGKFSDIQVSNGESQARITFSFMGDPEYAFSQPDSHSVALDIKQTGVIQGYRCSSAATTW